jgi:ATP-dependent Clp protease ATP-binding subunit ClpA
MEQLAVVLALIALVVALYAAARVRTTRQDPVRVTDPDLRDCIRRLTLATQASLGAAAGLAMENRNGLVEIEHWLVKLLDAQNEKVEVFLRTNEVLTGRLREDLKSALAALPVVESGEYLSSRGPYRDVPALSDEMVRLLSHIGERGSPLDSSNLVGPEQILFEILQDHALRSRLGGLSPELQKIMPESLERLVR